MERLWSERGSGLPQLRRRRGPLAKVALITGVTGQDGSYLAELLLKKGYEVHGIVRRSSSFATGRIDHLRRGYDVPGEGLQLHYGDLGDGTGLRRIIEQVRAGRGLQSRGAVARANLVRSAGVYRRCGRPGHAAAARDAARPQSAARAPARLYQAGSSEMFGKVDEIPQSETTPFHPRSPYACAKVYAHWQTVNYREAYELVRGQRHPVQS